MKEACFSELYPLRVLVVEDEPMNQKIIRLFLAKLGYDVLIVDRGAKAVLELEENIYDTVLMDIQMPEMDGFEATAEIRRSLGTSVYVSAFTALSEEELLQQGDFEVFDDYLGKPMRMASLKALLKRAFEGKLRVPAAS